ncbi:serine/threonine protein kinase [Endozoicomonas numazuensis]|uniref:serine/threonine protein kinase n=1 Tax=Endozoicomonas numazuensis TaxID=1137799 RepID=UPI00068E1E1A|nr:serine/threonine-protein kinase [Endozoicomonas numazuensis]
MSINVKNSLKPEKKKTGNRTVTDQYGTDYELTGLVGAGGQGTVCSTQYPEVLLKIFNQKSSVEQKKEWIDRIQWIMRQNLEQLNIASPKALIIKPTPGYVMELMDDLIPLQDLIIETNESLQNGEGLQGFLNTGGLTRRFSILAKLARLLADLHTRGLAYGDLSPANIFISKSINESEVWLIDCDNLATSCRLSDQHIHTPGYGAPEVVTGTRGINTLTDSWSFATIAFEILSLIHPLKGDHVEDGEPELEEQAYQGKFPWVDHPDDSSNSSSVGLSRDMISTRRLRELFEASFNAGMLQQNHRPTMNAWAEAFEAAANICISCESCRSCFVYKPDHICPFCDHKQSPDNQLLLRHYIYSSMLTEDKELNATPWVSTGHACVLKKQSEIILRNSAPGSRLYNQSEELCRIEYSDEGITIKPKPACKVVLQKHGSRKKERINRVWKYTTSERSQQRFMLHIMNKTSGSQGFGHNVWHFIW